MINQNNQLQKVAAFMSESTKKRKAVVHLLVACILVSQFFFASNVMAAAKRTTTKPPHNKIQKGNAFMGNSTNEKTKLRFIFITSFADIPFLVPGKKGMNDAAEQLGVSCDFTGPSGMDSAAQAKMIRQAVADGYDGIVLNILEAPPMAEAIAEVHKAGIPLVAFNVDDQSVETGRLSAICQNLYKAGQTLGKRAASSIADGSRVFIVMHDEGIEALEERRKGIEDGLKGKDITFEILIGGDNENAARVVTEQLKANPDVKAVLCTGQSDTEGTGFAIERNFNRQDYYVAGFDLSYETLRMIKDGTISFAIDQQPYAQGYYPVVQLTHYLRYGIAPSDMDAGNNIIDQDKAGLVIELSKNNYR